MVMKINALSLDSTKKYAFNIIKRKSHIKKISLPILSIPIVAYTVSPTSQKNLQEKLAKEAANKAVNGYTNTPISDRTEKNIKALKSAGVEEKRIKNYIKSDGRMDDKGKELCKKKNITSFKGTHDDTINPSADLSDGEFIGNMPPVYDDSSDMIEVGELDKAIGALNKVIDNPVSEEFAADAADAIEHLTQNPAILEEYKRIKPNAKDIHNYDNWQNWGYKKLETNANYLKKAIAAAKKNFNLP